MNIIPSNATLDYFKVCDLIRRHLNAAMSEAHELRSAKCTCIAEGNRQKVLIRAEESTDTLVGLLDELNAKYCELRPNRTA